VARLAKVAAKKFLASFRGFARHAKSFVARRGGSSRWPLPLTKKGKTGGDFDRLDAMIVNLRLRVICIHLTAQGLAVQSRNSMPGGRRRFGEEVQELRRAEVTRWLGSCQVTSRRVTQSGFAIKARGFCIVRGQQRNSIICHRSSECWATRIWAPDQSRRKQKPSEHSRVIDRDLLMVELVELHSSHNLGAVIVEIS
jgi:hypothetical protein